MFQEQKIKEIVLSTLIADSYSLGAHWIYDESQLKTLKIDWEALSAPCAIWHKGKVAGDFTHYGDQIFWLYKYCEDKNKFDVNDYLNFWQEKMKVYGGYIDGSTRETLANIKNNIKPVGSKSSDFSIVGRITPLLYLSSSKHEFLENVDKFTRLTHNSSESINAAQFFAKVLLKSFESSNFEDIFLSLKDESSTDIQNFIKKGISSKSEDSFEKIREFGPACGTNDGFASVIHLLCKYDNLKELLMENAKAGGDSSARAMVCAMVFTASHKLNSIPQSWTKIKEKI